MSVKPIDIGFLEEKSSWQLHPRFFPSKVGGKPAWLDLKNLPNPSELSCGKCENPLIFLCQVYAPYEDKDDCFHRTLFIFICRNGACCQPNSASNNIKVIRCQLARKNDFYSYEPYKEIESEIFPMEKWAKHCVLCGNKAPSHCSKCKKVYYCSRKHQILDWQKGHKEKCEDIHNTKECVASNFIVTETGKSLLFKEWDLIVDEEDEEDPSEVNVDSEMEKLKKMIAEKKAGTLSDVSETELDQYAKPIPEDKVFNKFSKRVARHPDQVLRYDKGGVPLWITSNTSNSMIHIPNCQYCGGERQFEFQIMPQLLNYINVGIELNSIDWGVIVVYTCKNSCDGEPAYKEEYVIKQDLSN